MTSLKPAKIPALVAAASAALLVSPAAAQQGAASAQPDLVPVTLWTTAVAALAMLVLSLGYLYRRKRGEPDEVIPTYVEPAAGSEDAIQAQGAGVAHGSGH